MENRNHGPRQSSLPSSLIPHLYSRPQHSDMPTSAFATTLPLPSSSGHESADFTERRELLPSMRTSFTLPPLSSVDTPRGQHYVNYHTRQSRQADPPQIHRAVSPIDIPLSLPSHLSSQQYGSTIHSDPQYHAVLPKRPYYGQSQNQNYQLPVPQEPGPPRGSWREGEAGPSSYIRTPYEARGSRGRRGSSQPAQSARLETYNFLGDMSDRGAESYPGALRQSSTQSGHFFPPWPEPYQNTGSYSSQMSTDYPQYPLTSINASHTWSGTGGDHPSGYSPSSVSDASSDGRVDNDDDGDESYGALHKGKKRRRDSDAVDDSKKNRNNRKTAVACNFCRGRKLRCDGVKPSCSNCLLRKFQCEYVPVQRRRGPGKAKKGTKSKKSSTTTGRMDPSTSLTSEVGSGLMPATEPTMAGENVYFSGDRGNVASPIAAADTQNTEPVRRFGHREETLTESQP